MPNNNQQPQGEITIKSGVNKHQVEAGKTVAQYRVEYGHLFRIAADAKAFSGTIQLADDFVVENGMEIEYVRKSGEKGGKAIYQEILSL